MVLWAIVLAALSLANLVLLSGSADSFSGPGVVWLIFILSVGFSLGFLVGAVGLWQQRHWGRLVFLWTVAIWASVNLVALFVPGLFQSAPSYTAGGLFLAGLRYLVSLLLPVWYLNLAHIKALFK